MTPIDRLSQIGSAAALSGGGPVDPSSVARDVMGTIGQRVSAWSAQVFGGKAEAGGAGFKPDAGELARRGDVYDLRPLISDTAQRFGAGPAEEGALLRAAEDFTRAAALHIYGGDRADSVSQALENASSDAGGVDGVIGHLQAATRELRAGAGS